MNPKRGFTIIELIMTIVLLVIIAVVAVPASLPISPDTRAYFAVRKIRSDIRYAQLLAMQQQSPALPPSVLRIRVVFYSPPTFSPPPPDLPWNGYKLEREITPNSWMWTPLTHPATRSDYTVMLDEKDYKGVTITSISLNASNIVIFDSYGRPLNSTGGALSEPAYVDVNNKYRLNFRAQTGKVDLTNL